MSRLKTLNFIAKIIPMKKKQQLSRVIVQTLSSFKEDTWHIEDGSYRIDFTFTQSSAKSICEKKARVEFLKIHPELASKYISLNFTFLGERYDER